MNLSPLAKVSISGPIKENKKHAKAYIDKIRGNIDNLNALQKTAMQNSDLEYINKIHTDDTIARADFELFGSKFSVEVLFSNGSEVPRFVVIKGGDYNV